MINHNQDGVSGVFVSLIIAIVFLLGAIGFGGWAYTSRQDYKDNVDAKIDVAVKSAKVQEDKAQALVYAEKEKQPFRVYNGPEAYGSIIMSFPKTWSGYADDTGNGSGGALVDAYFYPNIVPSVTGTSSVFAARVQVIDQSYSQIASTITGFQTTGKVKVSPFSLAKVPKVTGMQLVGSLPNQKTGTMVILPLRSQTIEIWTEGTQYINDFNSYILPNFSFVP